MEAAIRRTFLETPCDVSGCLSVAPNGTNYTTAQVDKRVPPGEQRNKPPMYVSEGVKGADSWTALARSPLGSWWPDEKGDPNAGPRLSTAYGLLSGHATLDESEGLSFQTFSIPEDRFVLLFKRVGKRMTETEIRQELEALHIKL
jgi:hypothetical protein